MRVRFLRSRMPQLVQSPTFAEEAGTGASETKREAKVEVKPRLTPIALVANLDAETKIGEGFEVWSQAVGSERLHDGAWLAKAAAFADLAIFLSAKPDTIAGASTVLKSFAAERGLCRPRILGGPFQTATDGADLLATYVDGLVLVPDGVDEEPEIEAELLRRLASTIGEKLMLEHGTWKQAPDVCLWARLDVLRLIPAGVCEWMMLDSPPEKPFSPWAKKLVLRPTEERTWWTEDYSVVGPDSIYWRPWMRDPKVAAG